jgi:hypothetical protein
MIRTIVAASTLLMESYLTARNEGRADVAAQIRIAQEALNRALVLAVPDRGEQAEEVQS